MPRCSKCGSGVKEGAKFCTKCGAKIISLSSEFVAQIEILKKRIEKDTLNPRLYEQLGEIYEQNYLLPEALVEYQKAVNIDELYFDAHLRSGEIYLTLEELEKAETSFQRALSLDPKSQEAGLGLFKVYHLRRKVEEGLKLGEELIQADPNNLEVHRALKEMYDEKGMSEEVFKELLTITALAPHDKEFFEELAGLYEERGDVENEIKCYQKVLELDPKDVVSRFSLGKIFCLRREYQKAVVHLKDIVEEMAHPFESYGHLYLALAHISQQDLDNAIQEIGLVSPLDYEELTVSDKKLLAEVYYKIGCAVFQRHNLSSAIDYLQKAIKYEPSNVEYQQHLETAKSEQASLKSKRRRKTLRITASFLTVVIMVIAGWYLSHGKIRVIITPAEDAKLYVDGKPLERGTALRPGLIISPSLFFGVHKITVEKDGYKKWEKDVRVGFGKTVSVEAKLVPIYGSLKVNSKPSGAEVYLDQKLLGKTPLVADEILATSHILLIKKPPYVAYRSAVNITGKDVLSLNIRLVKIFKDIKVKFSDPPNSYPRWFRADAPIRVYASAHDLTDGDPKTYVELGIEEDDDPNRQASLHWITLSFPDERYVTKIGLITCNKRIAKDSRFELSEVNFVFPDGTTKSATLLGSTFEMQYYSVEPPKKTSYVVIKPAKLRRRSGDFNQFAIAEIEIQGYEGFSSQKTIATVVPTSTREKVEEKTSITMHGYDDCKTPPATTNCCCFVRTHTHDLGQVFPVGSKLQIKYRAGTPSGHCKESQTYVTVSTTQDPWTLVGKELVPERRVDDIVHTKDYYPSIPFRYVQVYIPDCYNDWSSAEAWYGGDEQSLPQKTVSSGETQSTQKGTSGGIDELKETEAQEEVEKEGESSGMPFSQTVKIVANQQWTDVGIMLSKGHTLIIKVVGEINHGCGDCQASPNGGRRKCGQFHCGAVVGKIAIEGKTFLVGEYFEGTVSNDGPLFLGVVDTRYGDNRGEFTATVFVK